MKLETLANLVDAILDQTTDNEIKVSIRRREGGVYMEVVVEDNLSEICNVFEVFTDRALTETAEQLEDFVDGLSNGNE